jgi:hypothetical protein
LSWEETSFNDSQAKRSAARGLLYRFPRSSTKGIAQKAARKETQQSNTTKKAKMGI